jgi:hypothetical protein
MRIINRESPEDAKKVVEELINREEIRTEVLSFLADIILFANSLNDRNWNLNLDKNGGFIRFNVGHEYCLEIFKGYVSILALKSYLSEELLTNQFNIEFKGYIKKRTIVVSKEFKTLPDCLAKVPDSVACHVSYNEASNVLPHLRKSNQEFITYAIKNTTQLTTMNKAHSPGFISFLSSFCQKSIPNPTYFNSEEEFYRVKAQTEKEATKLSTKELMEKIGKIDDDLEPDRASMVAYRYRRSPYIVEYAKRIANGICQDCKLPAPFISKLTKEPFLETHHKLSLANGGKDTIENTIALCPNCHRKRHFG